MLMATAPTVPLNGTSTPFVGQQFEFVPEHAEIEIAIVADAVGVLATVYDQNDLVQQEGPVSVKAAGAPPVYPDDYHIVFDAAKADRLLLTLRNTTGANIPCRAYAKITPHV